MAFKKRWSPSKSQRREFAINMQNPEFAQAYEERKEAKAVKRRAGSQFDYNSAGGQYVPTREQHDAAHQFVLDGIQLTSEQEAACNVVMSGYSMNEKVHHDFIHIVNELRRTYAI